VGVHLSKLRSIQVLRGVAACAVVLLHARYFGGSPIDHSWARIGAAGVDLFFVISGFIMATIAKPSAGRFLFDRFWRIFPLWLVAVTPWMLYKHSTGPELIASLTLWPIYSRFIAPALIVGWSLSFELLFYVAMALAMRTGRAVPLALFGAALAAGFVTHAPIFDYLGNPIIFEFLAGVLIAQLPRRAVLSLPSLTVAVALFAVAPPAIYSADFAVDASVSAWRVLFWGFPAGLIVYGCLCAEGLFSRRAFDALVTLGDASYSIYLFHLVIILPLSLAWPLEIPLAIGLGLLIWRWVERPILRFRPKLRSAARTHTDARQEAAPVIPISS
jgi:exopolysaccharide production protein ExoZ